MEILEILLLSAALSIDALSIGASCGFGGIRMSFRARLIVLLVSVAVTGAAVGAGTLLNGVISALAGKLIGAALLLLIGGYMIVSTLLPKKEQNTREGVFAASVRMLGSPETCDLDHSKTIDYKEACILGLALSADSFAAGLSAGIGGGYALLTPLFCGAFQILFLICGELLAGRLRMLLRCDRKLFSVAAGMILIVTAVCRAAL